MAKEKKPVVIPEQEAIEAELNRLNYASRYRNVLRSTVLTLVVVAAFAILMATLFVPFLRIYGTSMTPTLENGQIVACLKTSDFKTGDVVAFYYNNKILVKRVIGQAGDYIDLDEDGTVYVNGNEIEEDYVDDKAYGETNISLPYQVPDSSVFVMGDHRSTSVDSRNKSVGCVSQEQIVGKVILRIWPMSMLGFIK